MASKPELPRKTAEIATPLSVETIQLASSIRYVIHFSIDLPEGKHYFDELTGILDNEITHARNQIIEKVGDKLGVKINFTE